MCRFAAYKGKSALIGDIIIIPENSLVQQSRDAEFHPGVLDPCSKRNIRVNGDGFGVAWYNSDPARLGKGSCCFKFTTPAWSNDNLRNIGDHVSSEVIFAHVRAASSGLDRNEPVIISNENCHPFKYGRWTFMHNGGIHNFSKIKRRVLASLSDRAFHNIAGSTDSEVIFSLFLDQLTDADVQLPLPEVTAAIEKTVVKLIEFCESASIEDGFSFNVCITDGINILATRFRSDSKEPPSLYYTNGSSYSREKGNFNGQCTRSESGIIIASAPLHHEVCVSVSECQFATELDTSARLSSNGWDLVPRNSLVVVEGDPLDLSIVRNVSVLPFLFSAMAASPVVIGTATDSTTVESTAAVQAESG